MIKPGERMELRGIRKNSIKSYWFKTFRHSNFTERWDLFYKNNKTKTIKKNFVVQYVNNIALAYWIRGDGYLQKDKNYDP